MSESRAQAIATAIYRDYVVCRKMRQTPERLSILRMAIDAPAHFSPADLSKKLKAAGFNFSLTTIYSTLSLLVDAGVLRRVTFDSHTPLYERSPRIGGNSRTRRHHHHLVCTSCGKIAETREPDISSALLFSMLGTNTTGFEPKEVSLTIYGLCRRCMKKSLSASAYQQ